MFCNSVDCVGVIAVMNDCNDGELHLGEGVLMIMDTQPLLSSVIIFIVWFLSQLLLPQIILLAKRESFIVSLKPS